MNVIWLQLSPQSRPERPVSRAEHRNCAVSSARTRSARADHPESFQEVDRFICLSRSYNPFLVYSLGQITQHFKLMGLHCHRTEFLKELGPALFG